MNKKYLAYTFAAFIGLATVHNSLGYCLYNKTEGKIDAMVFTDKGRWMKLSGVSKAFDAAGKAVPLAKKAGEKNPKVQTAANVVEKGLPIAKEIGIALARLEKLGGPSAIHRQDQFYPVQKKDTTKACWNWADMQKHFGDPTRVWAYVVFFEADSNYTKVLWQGDINIIAGVQFSSVDKDDDSQTFTVTEFLPAVRRSDIGLTDPNIKALLTEGAVEVKKNGKIIKEQWVPRETIAGDPDLIQVMRTYSLSDYAARQPIPSNVLQLDSKKLSELKKGQLLS